MRITKDKLPSGTKAIYFNFPDKSTLICHYAKNNQWRCKLIRPNERIHNDVRTTGELFSGVNWNAKVEDKPVDCNILYISKSTGEQSVKNLKINGKLTPKRK